MALGPLNPTQGVAYSNITPIHGATGGWTATSGDAPPPTFNAGTETETVEFPYSQTVSTVIGTSTTGGFQLVAGSAAAATAMSRQDH